MGEVATASLFRLQFASLPLPLAGTTNPAGPAKGCCGTARDTLVVDLAGHNSRKKLRIIMSKIPYNVFLFIV